MTPSRAQAISMVEQFPEEHIALLIQTLHRLQRSCKTQETRLHLTDSLQAVRNLQKYRKQGAVLIDYKKELADILEERRECIG